MTVKQEQRLIAELGKVITALDKAQYLAIKSGAIGTASDMQLHEIDIKHSIDHHTRHIEEVTNSNIID